MPLVSSLMRATPSSPRSVTMSVAPNSRASCLPRLVAAHRDDPLGAHLLRREHAEQTDRAVADDDDRRARLDVGRIGREPAGAHHVGQRQQARDQVVRTERRGVATSVPSASGTRSNGACAPHDGLDALHDVW